jgi:hypothetical protein
MVHKCNKCYHQAVVKFENSQSEFCVSLDIQINKKVKNCTEYIDTSLLYEPDDFDSDIEGLLKLLRTGPSLTEVKKKLDKISTKIEVLRMWGRQKIKPKLRK